MLLETEEVKKEVHFAMPISVTDKDIHRFIENDFKCRSLFNGDIGGYASRSEAELALCCKLVWFGCDDTQLDRVIRESKLGKWGDKSTKNAYRSLTIKKARSLVSITREIPDKGIDELISKKELSKFTNIGIDEVKSIVEENFTGLWRYTEPCLGVIATLFFKNQSDCTGLNLQGAPSSQKTTILSFFYGFDKLIYKTDEFSPKAFV